MKGKGVALVGVLFVALCAAYWLTVQSEKKAEIRSAEAQRLFTFNPEDLLTIRIARFGEEPVMGVREESGEWSLLEPDPAIPASPILWPRVAEHLANLSSPRRLDADERSAEIYGLEKSPLVVDAETTDGKKHTLRFGAMEPTQTRRYAQLDEGPVFLVHNDEYFELDRSLELLRDTRLVKVGEEGITRIEYTRIRPRRDYAPDDETAPEGVLAGEESISVILVRDGDTWRLAEPIEGLANWDAVDKLVRDIQFMPPGREFIDHPPALSDYGLDPAYERIAIMSSPGNEVQTLLLGAPKKIDEENKAAGIYIKTEESDSVCVVDPYILDSLPRTPTAFLERHLITQKLDGLNRIRYESGDTAITMETVPGKGWRITDPPLDESDQVFVSDWIRAMIQIEAMDVVGGRTPEQGFEQPHTRLELGFSGDKAPLTILVGGPIGDSGNHYALQDSGTVLSLGKGELNILTKSLFFFRNKRLLEFDPELARRVELTFEGKAYAFDRVEGRWHVTSPEGLAWETQSDMQALLEALSAANALHQEVPTVPADLVPYGLDAPVLEVTVTALKDADSLATTVVGPLRIGNPAETDPRNRYAITAARSDFILTSQRIIDDVRESLAGIVPK